MGKIAVTARLSAVSSTEHSGRDRQITLNFEFPDGFFPTEIDIINAETDTDFYAAEPRPVRFVRTKAK